MFVLYSLYSFSTRHYKSYFVSSPYTALKPSAKFPSNCIGLLVTFDPKISIHEFITISAWILIFKSTLIFAVLINSGAVHKVEINSFLNKLSIQFISINSSLLLVNSGIRSKGNSSTMRVPVIRMLTAARASKFLQPAPNFHNVLPQVGVKMPSALLQNYGKRFYTRHVPFVPPTVDELPVPSGSWEKNYKRQNEKYNQHLAFGIGFFIFTVSVVSYKVDFNSSPPPLSDSDDDDLCPAPPPEKKRK